MEKAPRSFYRILRDPFEFTREMLEGEHDAAIKVHRAPSRVSGEVNAGASAPACAKHTNRGPERERQREREAALMPVNCQLISALKNSHREAIGPRNFPRLRKSCLSPSFSSPQDTKVFVITSTERFIIQLVISQDGVKSTRPRLSISF